MDQISRPVLLALLAAVGFAAAWMTVLRPQDAEGGGDTAAAPAVAASTQPADAPGAGGLGRAVGKARGAVTTADAASAAAAAAAAGTETTPPPAAAAPATRHGHAAPPAREPRAVGGRTTVLLLAGAGADDAVAREVVRSVRGPGVRVLVAPIGDVARYKSLVGSVEIAVTPTILVVGKDRRAQRIEGLPDAVQLRQALRAAR
jgi:hypothetical protein